MITIVQADDWMAVYKDGEIIYQDHTIEPYFLLFLLGIPHEVIYAEKYVASFGELPINLSEVVEDD